MAVNAKERAERARARAEEQRLNEQLVKNRQRLAACGIGVRVDRDAAKLDCTATPSCGRWVEHVFSHHDVGKTHGENGESHVPVYYEVFRCVRCGAKRRWGYVAAAYISEPVLETAPSSSAAA